MKLLYKAHYLFVVAIILVASCKKSSTLEVKFEGDHYVKVDDIRTFKKQEILAAYNALSEIPGYELVTSMIPYVKTGVEIKRLKYQTYQKTSMNDSVRFVASGMLCYPDDYNDSYPVLCFHNGTNVEHSKAPTENYDDNLFFLLESLASLGFIVVIPDYPGFGSSYYKVHPYLIKDETVRSSKDILFATQEFLDQELDGADLNNDLYLMGYSQGAWATLQLQRVIELEGLGSFNLVASSCGSGPYIISKLFGDLFAVPDSIVKNPYFFAYTMNAYKEYGLLDTLELSDIFNEPYASRIPGLFNGKNTSQMINDSLATQVSELLDSTFLKEIFNPENLTYQIILDRLIENDVEGWNLTAPTRLYHGTADSTVSNEITEEMANRLTNFPIENKTDLLGANHSNATVPFGMLTLEWFIYLKNQP